MGSGISDASGRFLEDEISDCGEQGLRTSRNQRDSGPAAGPEEICDAVIFVSYFGRRGSMATCIISAHAQIVRHAAGCKHPVCTLPLQC